MQENAEVKTIKVDLPISREAFDLQLGPKNDIKDRNFHRARNTAMPQLRLQDKKIKWNPLDKGLRVNIPANKHWWS